jgi:hypothetical protein
MKSRREAMEEMDKVQNHLEGRLDRISLVIWRTSMQERQLAPTAAAEGTSSEDLRDSWENLKLLCL